MNKSFVNSYLYRKLDVAILPIYSYPTRNRHFYFFKNILCIFKLIKSDLSILNVIKYLYNYIGAIVALPASFFLYIFNIRFLLVDLSQIGSVYVLNLAIRKNINNRLKYIVLSANKYPLSNNYLIGLYSKKNIPS